MDKIKYIKLENQDGSYTNRLPFWVVSDNVDVNGYTLTEVLSTIETNKVNIIDAATADDNTYPTTEAVVGYVAATITDALGGSY